MMLSTVDCCLSQ